MFEHRKPISCGHVQIGYNKSGIAVRLPVRKLPLAHEVGNRFGAAVSELKRVLDAYRAKRFPDKNLVRLVVLNYQDGFVISHSFFTYVMMYFPFGTNGWQGQTSKAHDSVAILMAFYFVLAPSRHSG
jgi:hypothetical protein